MNTVQFWAAIVAALFGGGGVVSIVRAYNDRQSGISSNERQAKKDEQDSDDRYTDRLEKRMVSLERRQVWLENVNTILWNHIGALEEQHVIETGQKPIPRPALPPLPRLED